MEQGLDEFLKVLLWHLIPLVTFGVKQVPEATVDGQGPCLASIFKELARKLIKSPTGHAARDAIILCKDTATVEQWNMFISES